MSYAVPYQSPKTGVANQLLLLAVFLYFKIIGKRYPFSWSNAVLYAAAASLSLVHNILDWFLASRGRKGMFLASLVGLTVGLANWSMCLYFIPRLNVAGAGIASIAAGALGILLFEIAALHTTREPPSIREDAPAV